MYEIIFLDVIEVIIIFVLILLLCDGFEFL